MESNGKSALSIRKMALAAMLVAAGVILSPILRIPGMCPMQHFINIVAAVFLGPWYALAIAVMISIIRMSFFGINILAVTGSIFGAVLSGLSYRAFKNLTLSWSGEYVSLAGAWIGEIIGTGVIGALASYPALWLVTGGVEVSWYYYIPWFVAGTIIGGSVAYLLLCGLHKAGLLARFQHGLGAFPIQRCTLPGVLSIAGSDSSGGAGIQADIKAISANGCYAMTAITAITAQNTTGVRGVQDIDPNIIAGQIDAVMEDIPPAAVKVGMLSRVETIQVVADKLKDCNAPIVLDPVMVATSGAKLLQPEAVELLKTKLLPLAYLATPNLPEAEVLSGLPVDTEEQRKEAARAIHKLGCKYVLIKGGHGGDRATDLLYDGAKFTSFDGERIRTKNTHGTGCTLSSAIAANLAKGLDSETAVREGKAYISTAIAHSLDLGQGCGPTNPFYSLYRKAGIKV